MCELLIGYHFKGGADLDEVGSDNKGVATPLIGIEPEPDTGMPSGYFDYENPNSGLDGRVLWAPASDSMGASPGGKDYYYGVAMSFGPDQWCQ